MSNTAVSVGATATPAVPASPHQSWWARAITWLKKVGTEIQHGAAKVAAAEPKVAAAIAKVAPDFEQLSNMIVPGSGAIEALAVDAFSHIAKAIKDGGDAVTSVSITTPAGSLALDQQLIADIKDILPAIERFLHPQANQSPAPGSGGNTPASNVAGAAPGK